MESLTEGMEFNTLQFDVWGSLLVTLLDVAQLRNAGWAVAIINLSREDKRALLQAVAHDLTREEAVRGEDAESRNG